MGVKNYCKNKNIALVVPSNREDQAVDFLKAWRNQIKSADVVTYLVEDNEEETFTLDAFHGRDFHHLSWRSVPQSLLDCISLNSPGCRQIGFFIAFEDGCEIIVTLDDDVRPVDGSNVFTSFSEILSDGVQVWVDPLLNYRSRGYPFKNTGTIPVSFHVGSFLGVPDVDGETQLRFSSDFAKYPPQYIPRPTIVPAGQLLPVNGGMCGWRRELTPYVHYTLWNPELSYRRFDDIWMGIILKRFLDLTGMNMSYGTPYVAHIRASNAKHNMVLEKEGRCWNETFWQYFDRELEMIDKSRNHELENAFQIVVEALFRIDNQWSREEAEAMVKWRSFFP